MGWCDDHCLCKYQFNLAFYALKSAICSPIFELTDRETFILFVFGASLMRTLVCLSNLGDVSFVPFFACYIFNICHEIKNIPIL